MTPLDPLGLGDLGPGHVPTPRQARPSVSTDDINELKADIERLLLVTEALWKIVQEKLGLDEKELLKQITMLDMSDGRLDARKGKEAPKMCPKCNRALPKRRPRCMFCGEPVMMDPFQR
jgi:uncharacterized paraquat-inducible protein A